MVATGHEAYYGVGEGWLGSGGSMYWSHADATTYGRSLRDTDFEVVDQAFVPEGRSGHERFRARAPDGIDKALEPNPRNGVDFDLPTRPAPDTCRLA